MQAQIGILFYALLTLNNLPYTPQQCKRNLEITVLANITCCDVFYFAFLLVFVTTVYFVFL